VSNWIFHFVRGTELLARWRRGLLPAAWIRRPRCGTASRRELLTLKGHADEIWSVAFSPDCQRLKGHNALIISVAFSPDGQRILTGSWDQTSMGGGDRQTGWPLGREKNERPLSFFPPSANSKKSTTNSSNTPPTPPVLHSTIHDELAAPAGWATNSPAPVVVNGQFTVTNPITGTPKFYRLRQ
jgi:hypothetical protein